MKVGTDGILLGAWADVSDCQYILDMGDWHRLGCINARPTEVMSIAKLKPLNLIPLQHNKHKKTSRLRHGTIAFI